MRRKPEHASISFASTTRLPTRLNRVRKADRPHCTTCSVVCSCARLLLLFSSWLLCRRTLIAKGVTLSQIDLELTSQTVVFEVSSRPICDNVTPFAIKVQIGRSHV